MKSKPSPQKNYQPIIIALIAIVLILIVIAIADYISRDNDDESTLRLPTSVACAQLPQFVKNLGFTTNAIIDTSDKRVPGFRIIDPNTQPLKVKHETEWEQAGFLGAPIIDNAGDIYVAPAPHLNQTLNPPERQNTIYRVRGADGKMEVFATIPQDQDVTEGFGNPYGILAMAFDCQTKSLYVSTIAGSNSTQERGHIVRIQISTGKITSQIDAVDAFAVEVGREGLKGRLYFGKTREPSIWSVQIDQHGDLIGKPKRELNYGTALQDAYGRAKRISFDFGRMTLRILPFDYTLVPHGQEQQTVQAIFTTAWEVLK